jgi:hypothetical protein
MCACSTSEILVSIMVESCENFDTYRLKERDVKNSGLTNTIVTYKLSWVHLQNGSAAYKNMLFRGRILDM